MESQLPRYKVVIAAVSLTVKLVLWWLLRTKSDQTAPATTAAVLPSTHASYRQSIEDLSMSLDMKSLGIPPDVLKDFPGFPAAYLSCRQSLDELYKLQRENADTMRNNGVTEVDIVVASSLQKIKPAFNATDYNARMLGLYNMIRWRRKPNGTKLSRDEESTIKALHSTVREFWDVIMLLHTAQRLPADFFAVHMGVWAQRSEDFKSLVEVVDIAYHYRHARKKGHYMEADNRPVVYQWLDAMRCEHPAAWRNTRVAPSTAFAVMEQLKAAGRRNDEPVALLWNVPSSM